MSLVLVCGGRHYSDYAEVDGVLNAVDAVESIDLVLQGGAAGADNVAALWAVMRGVHVATVEALWSLHGPAAGPMRNAKMLLLRPDVVVAFPGGRGTADMVRKARAAGVRVVEVG